MKAAFGGDPSFITATPLSSLFRHHHHHHTRRHINSQRFPTPHLQIRTQTRTQTRMTLKADLDHIALDCKDRDAMVKFYTETLDFEHMQMKDAPFPSVRLSDVTIIDFFKSEGGGGLNNTNHFCMSIAKEDYKELQKRLHKAGIETAEPKLRGGAKGRGWSVYIRDPEENMLEFRWYD